MSPDTAQKAHRADQKALAHIMHISPTARPTSQSSSVPCEDTVVHCAAAGQEAGRRKQEDRRRKEEERSREQEEVSGKKAGAGPGRRMKGKREGEGRSRGTKAKEPEA